MEILLMESKKDTNHLECFYPSLIGIWEVTISTTFGKHKELMYTYGDGVTKHLGFIDEKPKCKFTNVLDDQIIDCDFEEKEFYKLAYSALKRYLIYRRRVWETPIIKCKEIKLIYQPYYFQKEKGFMGKERWYVYEPVSGSKDPLKKHKILRDYLLNKGEVI